MRLENLAYEPVRRDSREFFRAVVESGGSVCLAAFSNAALAGFCFGVALERCAEVGGARADKHWGEGKTLYSADLTVAPAYRGRGLGLRLKRAQIQRARSLGYQFIVGRNRVGLADPMWQLNQKFGAYQVRVLENSYSDGPGPRDAIYYRIDLADRQLVERASVGTSGPSMTQVISGDAHEN